MKSSLLFLMATAAGITVANIYYNQPLLEQMRISFGVTEAQIGWIPTLTQAGYALGMLLLVPIGDMLERRTLVLFSTLLSAAVCIGIALAQSYSLILLDSFLLGLATMTPQFLIPFAAHLSKPEERGKTIGTMMSGVLLGILLARTVAGFIGATWGWRTMFGVAAVALLALAGLMAARLPKSSPTYRGTYKNLLASVFKIFIEQPELREASLFGAMLFGSFSVFWANLIHLMETPTFNLGPRAVGLFGLLGAAAAALTPFIGSWIDKKKPRTATGIMILLSTVSFVIFGFSASSLLGLAIGVIVMDIGTQAGHVSNQTRIFRLIENAQSRIQTAYMFFYFFGGAIGSFLGTWAWSIWGWTGVSCAGAAMLMIAGTKFLIGSQQAKRSSS